MKFQFECDNEDGLVLIDESYLSQLDDEMLYAMDILLDTSGKTELIYDFPGEEWTEVRARETKSIRAFCESGKMLLWLLNYTEKECDFDYDANLTESARWLHIPTGKLLAVTAVELIQCVAYPELEMEKVFELTVPAGWYAFSNQGIDVITYCKGEPLTTAFENIQEISK